MKWIERTQPGQSRGRAFIHTALYGYKTQCVLTLSLGTDQAG